MWTYSQSTGTLTNPEGDVIGHGYAGGNCGKNPEGVNNPSLQSSKGIGPLPQGYYTLAEPLVQSHLGPFAIPLLPKPENKMYGRAGFYVHGDNSNLNNSASEGCIIMPRGVRQDLWDSDDHLLKVIQ